jgi:hypothetical protein
MCIALYNRDNAEVFGIPKDRHILFLGNSHFQTAINDSLITGGYNLSMSAEELEDAYAKLLLVKKYNPQVDQVVMCLDNVLEFKGKGSDYDIERFSPRYMEAFTFIDAYRIYKRHTPEYTYDNWIHLMDIIKLLTHRTKVGIGGFHYKTGSRIEKAIAELPLSEKVKVVQNDSDDKITDADLTYLDLMKDFCKQNNIRLIFMCVPQHRLSPLDKQVAQRLHDCRYPDVPFYNYINMELPDSCYGDLDHLNYRGAKVFSEYIESSGILK